MREAGFNTVFCGIETPEPEALKAMSKAHNMMTPMLESVATLNSYGMEVVSGIILGLDTDTPQSGERILEFIEASHIPMATINLLQALPRTPLWDRLKAEERLIEDDDDRESNVDFVMPYEEVVAMWRDVMARAYAPESLFARYEHQAVHTWPNRFPRPASPQRASWRNIRMGLIVAVEGALEGGSEERLPPRLLALRLAQAQAGRDRERDPRGARLPSPDPLRPRGGLRARPTPRTTPPSCASRSGQRRSRAPPSVSRFG